MKTGKSDAIRVVEWRMLDKRRFYPNSVMCSFFSQCVIYPNTLIRTRLQMQQRNDLYSGTFDAYKKILRTEGFRGLYRGFWVSSFQVVHGVCYVTVYECIRHLLGSVGVKNTEAKAMIGGSCAAVVGETIIVPCDVISQHLMMSGLANTRSKQKRVASEVIRTIYNSDGLRGFYRGYTASLSTFVPSSALWWTFYHVYQGAGTSILPDNLPHIGVQALAGLGSAWTTSLLTNPLDLIRVTVQLEKRSVLRTVRKVWQVERWRVFTKGLTARITSASILSLMLIFGYETVKKVSVYEEYEERILW